MEYPIYTEDDSETEYVIEYTVGITGKHERATRHEPEQFPEYDLQLMSLKKNDEEFVDFDKHPDCEIVRSLIYQNNGSHADIMIEAYLDDVMASKEASMEEAAEHRDSRW